MSKSNAQLIDPKQEGHGPLSLTKPVFDAGALTRAEDALKGMSDSFEEWLDRDVTRLHTARLAARAGGWSVEGLEVLMTVSHDVKGMGGTYGYPLVTQMAASLCRLIETPAGKAAAQGDPSLVDAHVDAIRAAARDAIKTDGNPVGRNLLHALEERVARLGVAPR